MLKIIKNYYLIKEHFERSENKALE